MTSKFMSKQDALKEILDVLKSAGFSTEVVNSFVHAKLEYTKLDNSKDNIFRIFIELRKRNGMDEFLEKYIKAGIINVLHVSKFRRRLQKLKIWFSRHQLEPSKKRSRSPFENLGKDVLTHFDWHASIPDEQLRRKHLVDAASVLGEVRVDKALAIIKNTWKKQLHVPPQYKERVNDDYKWFHENFGSVDSSYYGIKKMFTYMMQGQCPREIECKLLVFY